LAIATVPHPHAVESGPQRRIFQSQSAAALLPVTIDPEYHYERSMLRITENLSSLLCDARVMRAEKLKAFARFHVLHPDNAKVLASSAGTKIKQFGGMNLSRFAQSASSIFALSAACPDGSLSRNLFRPIKKSRYVITLAHMPTTGSPASADRRPPDVKEAPSATIHAHAELHTLLNDGQRDSSRMKSCPIIQTRRWLFQSADLAAS